MTEYICKCGRKLQRSTQSETTGNKLDGYAPGHECFGCPYVVPITRWENGHFVPDHYECVASKELRYETYASLFSFDRDSTAGHILSLDFDFLRRVAAECDKHEATISLNRDKGGQMFHYKSKYRPDGRFDFTIYPTQNKAGANAKRAIFEKFFTDGGARKDLTPEQEKEKILNDIQEGLRSELPQPYIPGDVYIDPTDHSRMRVVDVTPDKKERTWQVQIDDGGGGWGPANSSFYPHLHDAVATLGAFVRSYGLIPDQESNDPPKSPPTSPAASNEPPEIVDESSAPEPAAGGSEPKENALAEHPVTSELPQRPGDVFKAPNGTLYKIADKLIGKQRCWHTVRFNPSTCEWLAVNSTVYDNLENALGEFAAWIRTENLKPVARNGAAATAAAEEPALPPAEPAPDNTTAEPAAGGSEPEERALAANPVTSELSQPAAFDYSGLDAQTVADLHLAEREYASGKRMAEMGLRRMADGVAIAHDALCGTVVHNVDNGQFDKKEDTFRRWCESVGVGKSTAYKLLHVSYFLDQSTPEEQKLLEQLSPSLLYAGAKPSADPEMVQDLKDGKISTLKEWNQREAELKAQLKAKSDELAAVKAEAARRAEQIKAREEEARAAAHLYHEKYEEANAARNAALDAQGEFARRAADAEQKATRFAQIKDAALDQVKQAQAKLEAERSDSRRAAAQLQQRIRELETRPVEVVAADPDEVNRLAEEKAQAIAAQRSAKSTRDRDAMQQRIEELEELLDDAAQDQIANTQALAVQAMETCESLMESLFGKILFLPDKEYLPAKRIVESFYAKLGWVLENDDWPDENDWALNHSSDDADEPDEEEAEEDE